MTNSSRHRPIRQRRGFVFLDAVAAIVLLGAIAVLLATATGRQAKAAARLKDDRAALRRAEAALLALGDPQRSPPTLDADLRIRRLDAGDAPEGWTWIAVAAPSGTRQIELVGLVPDRGEVGR